jgi:RimJ/RimL family protein N-acetyltransferase
MNLDCGQVLLRPFEESDREALVLILGAPDLMKYALDERPLSREDADAFIDGQFVLRDGLGLQTVCLKRTGAPIGFSGYRACRYLDAHDIEFGWVLASDHHGRGYATAIGAGLIDNALTVRACSRVLAACNPNNQASEHILLDKLRMRFERDVEPRPGFRRRVYAGYRR